MQVAIDRLQQTLIFVKKNKNSLELELEPKSVITLPNPNNPKTIPTFYFKPPKNNNNPIFRSFAQAVEYERIERVDDSLLTGSDLTLLSSLVRKYAIEGKMLDYQGFCNASRNVEQKMLWLFRAELFLQLPKSEIGLLSVSLFLHFTQRAAALVEAQFMLYNYTNELENHLTEDELQQYIEDMMPHLNRETLFFEFILVVKPQTATIRKFYICTAIRKFTFYHDKMRQGRISINDIAFSATLSEMHELRDPELSIEEMNRNWFSSEFSRQVYGDFLRMDVDRNGMLSRKELARIRNGTLTKSFLDRLFLNVQLFSGEMDYLVYLDFVLALEGIDTPEGMAWIFKILDIKNDGFLDESTISFFIKDVVIHMFANEAEPVLKSDIINEIFDMANPEIKDILTLNDLKKSGVGGMILKILIDVNGFQQYDSRGQPDMV